MKKRLEMTEETFLRWAHEENNQTVSAGSLQGQKRKTANKETSLPISTSHKTQIVKKPVVKGTQS